MIIKNLKNTPFISLMDCFHKCFENYFVSFPRENQLWKKRWENVKVDYSLSYGMFVNDKLVGFIINAVDYRNGKLIAFNTGTGVLPEYRGKRIVKSIYKYALPDLKKNRVELCRLEVIKENIIAIKSYQSIGFKITKNYKCYTGKIKLSSNEIKELKEINFKEYSLLQTPNQEFYSWDNHKNAIRNNTDYAYYKVLSNNKITSCFAINSKNGYVSQFDCVSINNYTHLFKSIQQISKTIKINNVDEQLMDKISFLKKIGLKNTVNQFEMELLL